jgi:hypothetical protein
VAAIHSLCEAGGGAIDADTYASEGSWQAALRSTPTAWMTALSGAGE